MSKMRLFALAAALSGLAAFIAAAVLGDPAGASKGSRPVLVAAKPIGLGETVRADAIQKSSWHNDGEPLPAGLVAAPESVVGRVARAPIPAGRVLREADFYPPPDAVAMSVGIGMRAYVARISDLSLSAGFGGPGSVVDVMLSATRNVPQPFSRIILTSVRVLAVRADVKPGDGDAKAPVGSLVTFELTPEQVEAIDLARTLGDLTIVTRNPADPDNAVSGGARVSDLIGASQPLAAPPPQPVPAQSESGDPAPPRVVYVTKPAPPPPPVVQEIRGGTVVMKHREPS